MKTTTFHTITNREGSALILCVLILMVCTIIGLLASRSSNIDLKIGTNDKTHKMTWHSTDAICDGLMPELIEQNIATRGFGDDTPPISYGNSATNAVQVYKSDFFKNKAGELTCPAEDNRDIEVPGLNQTDVYVTVGQQPVTLRGNSLLMAEGYHGRGKSAAGGGTGLLFTIRGLGNGVDSSRVTLTRGWLHIN